MVQRQNSAPIEAKVENLRQTVNSDNILPDTMRKFDGGFAFKIEGIPRQTYLYRGHVIEIYLP